MYALYKQEVLYTVYCLKDSCNCGYNAIHMSAKYGYWEMAEKLIAEQIEDIVDIEDCDEDSATHVAIYYDHIHFVKNTYAALRNVGRHLNETKIFNLATKTCSPNVAKGFLNSSANYSWNIWDVLLRHVRWSPCDKSSTIRKTYCMGLFIGGSVSETEEVSKESEKHLSIIRLLIQMQDELLIYDKKDDDNLTLLHHAALFGFNVAVKYLVELGADQFVKDKNGYTPLMIALQVAPSNDLNPSSSYRCYTTRDGLFSSCKTTCYDETARYLIDSQRANISKCDDETAQMLYTVIIKRMPLSLYALLKIGVDWNCGSADDGISNMQLHLYHGGREVSEVLKIFEIDVSVKCGAAFSELHWLSHFSITGVYGNFFRPSVNKKRFPLQRYIDRHPSGARILDECFDDEGYLPIHRAIEGGNLDAIKWFKSVGVNIQQKTQSGLPPIYIALFYLKNNLHKSNFESNILRRKDLRNRIECFEEVFRAFFDALHKNYSSEYSTMPFSKFPILHEAVGIGLDAVIITYKKALEIIPNLKKYKYLLLDEQDENGNTPLHIAAYLGRENIVKYLVRLGAHVNIKNKDNNIPMVTALVNAPHQSIPSYKHKNCYITSDGLFTSCKTTAYDEIVHYLIWLKKTTFSKCDDQSAFLLNTMIRKRMPLSLYALLKIGVDVNCKMDNFGTSLNPNLRRFVATIEISPFLEHIRERGREISEVMKIFEVNISVKCEASVEFSELHLISYESVSKEFGNFFNSSLNDKPSPLQRLINHHPRGVRILDECYDADGYLPIHRAAQGGNLVAIEWFKSVGVNMQLKTRSGLTALDISILYLGDISHGKFNAPMNVGFSLHRPFLDLQATVSNYRNKVFEVLLIIFFDTMSESKFLCGQTLEGLSPLHIAAVKGISVLRYVHKKARKIFPSLPINCINEHQLDPLYLLQFYDNVRNEGLIDKYSEESSNVIWHILGGRDMEDKIYFMENGIFKYERKKGQNDIKLEFGHERLPAAQYPDREIDYFMAFSYLYHPPIILPSIDSKPLYHTGGMIDVSHCPDYYTSPNFIETNSFSAGQIDASVCANLSGFDKLLCLNIINDYMVAYNCQLILKLLRLRYIRRRRRANRKLTQFMLERLGWSDSSKVKRHIDDLWPFYFLHKLHVKKYAAYEYLKVLNAALEVVDFRFYSHSLYDIIADLKNKDIPRSR